MKTQKQVINEIKDLVNELDDRTQLHSVLETVISIIEDDDSIKFLDQTLRQKFSEWYLEPAGY